MNDANTANPWKGNVWQFTIPSLEAYNPYPVDGAKNVDADVTLTWTAGMNTKLHTVYFGEIFDEVDNATVGIPQPDTSFDPGTLELEKTYYWRVDEFDGFTTHKGHVWSFSTKPYIPITDPNLLCWWKIGTSKKAKEQSPSTVPAMELMVNSITLPNGLPTVMTVALSTSTARTKASSIISRVRPGRPTR